MSKLEVFKCELATCNHISNRYNNLLRHYRENPSHKPSHFITRPQGRPIESSDDVISAVFNNNLSPRTRLSRVITFIEKLSDDELRQHCLPRLCKSVKTCEFLLESAKSSKGLQVYNVGKTFIETRDALAKEYPELVNVIFSNTTQSEPDVTKLTRDQIISIIEQNKHLVCEWVLSGGNEQFVFKDILMKNVYEQHKEVFLEVSSGIVGSLSISQKNTQDILRNTWGEKLSHVLGFNIFPPKDKITKRINKKKRN